MDVIKNDLTDSSIDVSDNNNISKKENLTHQSRRWCVFKKVATINMLKKLYSVVESSKTSSQFSDSSSQSMSVSMYETYQLNSDVNFIQQVKKSIQETTNRKIKS